MKFIIPIAREREMLELTNLLSKAEAKFDLF